MAENQSDYRRNEKRLPRYPSWVVTSFWSNAFKSSHLCLWQAEPPIFKNSEFTSLPATLEVGLRKVRLVWSEKSPPSLWNHWTHSQPWVIGFSDQLAQNHIAAHCWTLPHIAKGWCTLPHIAVHCCKLVYTGVHWPCCRTLLSNTYRSSCLVDDTSVSLCNAQVACSEICGQQLLFVASSVFLWYALSWTIFQTATTCGVLHTVHSSVFAVKIVGINMHLVYCWLCVHCLWMVKCTQTGNYIKCA